MKLFPEKISKILRVLEAIIVIAITIAIAISMFSLITGMHKLLLNPFDKDTFLNFLGITFNILIGIEFLKMIFQNNVNTVIEVLLFAIARQLIINHSAVFENFIGIASIAVIFFIRKYLFTLEMTNNRKQNDIL